MELGDQANEAPGDRVGRAGYVWLCVLAAGSGAAALGHQVLWTRRMVDVLGASGESTARVFACFFLGLALGAGLGGWVARRLRRPWLALGWAETAVAVLCLPVIFLPYWTDGLWPWLGAEGLQGHAGGWVKFFVSVAAVLPPAVLMGFFLPLAGRAVLGGSRGLGTHGLILYALNTMGGVFGLALVAVVLLPTAGALVSMLWILGLNILVAAGAFAGHRLWERGEPPGLAKAPTMAVTRAKAHSPRVRPLIGWLAFASGFLVLASELAFLQMVLLAAPLSLYGATAVLIAVIFSLGVASALTPWAARLTGGAGALLPLALAAAAVVTILAPLPFHLAASAGMNLFEAAAFGLFFLRLAGFCLLVFGPVFLLSGLVLPALFAAHAEASGDVQGRSWGFLLAVNGLGGFLGAELAYRWMLPALGLYGTVVLCAAVYAFLGLGVTLAWRRDRPLPRWPFIVAVPVVALAAFPVLGLPVVNPQLPVRVLHAESGREGTLAVIEGAGFGRALLLQNQYMLGSTAAAHEQERIGHLPLLLHPQAGRVAVIGLATGTTAAAALRHETVQQLDVVELSRSVAGAAAIWFPKTTGALHADPRARVVIEDGRIFIAAHRDAFDVITGDLFLPWGPGEGRLFAVEHFVNVRQALRSGGVFVQWLPLHQLTRPQLDLIRASFAEVFGSYELFHAGFDTTAPLLALVGWRDGALDWSTVQSRTEALRPSLPDPLLRHAEGLALLYLGTFGPAATAEAGRNTLDNLALELEAGRRRVIRSANDPYLTEEAWILLQRELRHTGGGPLEGGRFIEHAHALRTGDRARAPRALPLPEALRRDTAADWSRWPGPDPRRPLP